MTPDERWLAAVWPFVRASLPTAPASVVEIGCGPLGGFVPMLGQAGYRATGADPEAPAGPSYRQVEVERSERRGRVEAVVDRQRPDPAQPHPIRRPAAKPHLGGISLTTTG